MQIQFVNKPSKIHESIIVKLCSESSSKIYLSPMECTALQLKPHDRVVELLTEMGRVLLLRERTESRQSREEAGAMLFRKVTEGKEKHLFLSQLSDLEHLDYLSGFLLSSWNYKCRHNSLMNIEVVCENPEYFEKNLIPIRLTLRAYFTHEN